MRLAVAGSLPLSSLFVTLLSTACAPDATFEAPRLRGAMSAARAPGESYLDAVAVHAPVLDEAKADGHDTPYSQQVPLADLDLSSLPAWSLEELDVGFRLVRDTRFIESGEQMVRRP